MTGCDPDRIRMIVPTRGRPLQVRRLIASIERTAARLRELDLWLYVDDDDAATLGLLDELRSSGSPIDVGAVIGPRTSSQGRMLNLLQKHAGEDAGLYWFGTDKSLFLTSRWDDEARRVFRRHPDRLVVAFLVDTWHSVYLGATGFLSAEWIQLFGRVLSERFPFWFDDNWINQVALLLGRRVRLDALVGIQGADSSGGGMVGLTNRGDRGGRGVSMRIRNLAFWRRFYDQTLSERVDEADRARRVIFPVDSADYRASANAALRIARVLRDGGFPFLSDRNDYKHLNRLEKSLRPEGRGEDSPSAGYRELEARAVLRLWDLARVAMDERRFSDAVGPLDAIIHADGAPEEVSLVYQRCLRSVASGAPTDATLAKTIDRLDAEIRRMGPPDEPLPTVRVVRVPAARGATFRSSTDSEMRNLTRTYLRQHIWTAARAAARTREPAWFLRVLRLVVAGW